MTSSTFNSDVVSRSDSQARAKRAYGYRQLLRDSVIVAVAFAAVNLAVFYSNPYFEKQRRYEEVVRGAVERHGLRAVFAGDSHFATPLNGLLDENPRSPAYSVAFGGDSPREMFAKLRYVVQSNPTVDTLVISADPHMFGNGRLQSANRVFANVYFLSAMDRTGLRDGWIAASLSRVPLFNGDFIQYLRKSFSLRMSHHSRTSADDAVRAADTDSSWQSLTDEQRAAIARKTGMEDHRGVGEHPMSFYWYSRIFALAREHHLRVIGLRLPVHPQYRAQVSLQRVAEIDAFMRSEGVTQVADLGDVLSNPLDFEDPDHVNQEGAAKLLRILSDNITYRSFAGVFRSR